MQTGSENGRNHAGQRTPAVGISDYLNDLPKLAYCSFFVGISQPLSVCRTIANEENFWYCFLRLRIPEFFCEGKRKVLTSIACKNGDFSGCFSIIDFTWALFWLLSAISVRLFFLLTWQPCAQNGHGEQKLLPYSKARPLVGFSCDAPSGRRLLVTQSIFQPSYLWLAHRSKARATHRVSDHWISAYGAWAGHDAVKRSGNRGFADT